MDMQKYIFNILELLRLRANGQMSQFERYRNYGALECALQVVGALKGPGNPFDYHKVDVVEDYIFFKRRYRRAEHYGEMIQRVAKEWLEQQATVGGLA